MGKQEYLNILRKNNLKITPKRAAILELFLNEQKFFTPREIRSSLQTDFEHLGLPT
ncbi:MAG TPA: transcriptional repressor, partial [Candidatus Cloacimonetes bacterium]|nr:transcriptional repressor [Candidatus Cloacimonadota bacterium]